MGINPIPPCWSAWLVMSTLPLGSNRYLSTSGLVQNAADTGISTSSAIEIIPATTPIWNIVPMHRTAT